MNITYKKNKLIFTQSMPTDRAVIVDSELKDLGIKFKGVYNNSKLYDHPKSRFNNRLLTGCLTLVDTVVENISINSNNSACEDAINLLRVKGAINLIEISNSFSDALDIDFSEIYINKIKINGAGNDCVDISSGRVDINNVEVSDCGDKGLSVGEMSSTNLGDIDIVRSNIGISSKDSSNVIVENMKASNVNICANSYNKKQEFNGAYLEIVNAVCNKNIFSKDNLSVIIK
jgi:hypothetical protein